MKSTTAETTSLVAEIRRQTATANRNNVTRTEAYLRFYRQYPEIHWALLAHLVSRNGGWNMTDLKGEWLPILLDEPSIASYFWFLERCNWLIFYDAYPQLLLYAKMKETGEDLTSLLAPLGVSSFMHGFWQAFLSTKDSARLTRALIVNEQQYIEQRVAQKPYTVHRIFSSLAFLAQSAFSLNQVLFPFKAHATDKRFQLVGLNVHDFPTVEQRIAIGKTLYGLLYEDDARLARICQFAYRIPHTGSRADYWPHLFTPHAQNAAEPAADVKYELRLHGAELREGRAKLYSPALSHAWPDVEHAPADGFDWFRDPKWLETVDQPADLPTIDTDSYVRALHWIESGVKLVSLFS
ncbi:DUF2515 family protein [Brevibacillus sp. TJ4]|uniref:DUF2515 family protein n=1 Tax=Brevibacillus sp. TJ4 TaxID=3234853 RepID=UPI0037D6C94A